MDRQKQWGYVVLIVVGLAIVAWSQTLPVNSRFVPMLAGALLAGVGIGQSIKIWRNGS